MGKTNSKSQTIDHSSENEELRTHRWHRIQTTSIIIIIIMKSIGGMPPPLRPPSIGIFIYFVVFAIITEPFLPSISTITIFTGKVQLDDFDECLLKRRTQIEKNDSAVFSLLESNYMSMTTQWLMAA